MKRKEILPMIIDQFVGTWKLGSSEFRRSDGNAIYPYGKDAVGLIIYGADELMSVRLMRSDRPAFASGDILKGTVEEIKAAFEGYLAYFGTYDVNEQDGTVTHHIQGSSFPNWVGQDQKRYFKFSDNRLTLSTPPIPAGDTTVTGLLIWERAL